MRIQEYEAKEMFKQFGIAVPPGKVAKNDSKARDIGKEVGLPVVIKAQVLVGGRGKAGGIKIAESLEEVEQAAREILSKDIKGYQASEVLVEKKLDIKHEFYCGITIDRTKGCPVIMLSSEGGINIEEIAEKSPDKIFSLKCDPLSPIYTFQIIDFVKKLGLHGKILLNVSQIIESLYKVFIKYDGIIAEINPLVITNDDDVLCADAVFQIDDSALFRHPLLEKKKYDGMSPRTIRFNKKGATYVQLDGNIGLICSGAGLAMATMDTIKTIPGLSPANFLETGGGITAELMEDCMEIILEENDLKAIFINLYGGINPIHEGAKGVAKVIRDKKLKIPVVAKALGNKQEETWKIFEEAGVYVYKSSDTQGAVRYLAEIIGGKE
jgi:succinyl-CoA synthetase beta subunit